MEPTQALEEIQPASERTQTIEVTERQVALGANGPEETTKQTKVFVRPLPFRRWLTAMQYISSLLTKIPEDGLKLDTDAEMAVSIVLMLGSAETELIALASLATDKEADFFDRIDPDDGVKIILAVIKVNKDFFVQKVLPLVNEHLPEVKETFGQTQ